MKSLLLLFAVFCLATLPLAGTDYIIGTGTPLQVNIPLNGFYDYGWSRILYTIAEINAAGLTHPSTIGTIGFYVYGCAPDYTAANQTIYMRLTMDATIDNSYPDISGFTAVYSGSVIFNPTQWIEVRLSTPFYWDNSSNIEILWENHSGLDQLSYPTFCYTATPISSHAAFKHQNDSFPAVSGALTRYRPNILFGVLPDVAVATYPANGASYVPTSTVLSWTGGGGVPPLGYKLYFGPGSSPTYVGDIGLVTAWMPPSALAENTIYRWKIVPYNANGETPNCPMWTFTTQPASVLQVGYSSSTDSYLPISAYYGYSYSQCLYLPGELSTAHLPIKSVAYYWNGVSASVNSTSWTIYMGHTTRTAFSSVTDWVPSSELTQVFTGTVSLPAVPGWIIIPLQTPFAYKNSGSLVIAVDENQPLYDAYPYGSFHTSPVVGARSLLYRHDGTNPDPAAPPAATYQYAAIANIVLDFIAPLTAFPFTEGFEAISFPPANWLAYNLDGTTPQWTRATYQYHGGTASALHSWGGTSPDQDGWLVLPPLKVTAGYSLKFWNFTGDPGFYRHHGVMLSTGSPHPQSGNFTEIWSPAGVSNTWEMVTIPLDAYAGTTIHLAFRYLGANGDLWYLDDIEVSGQITTDASMISIDSPQVCAPVPYTPQVTVRNNGTASQDFQVRMYIGAGYQSLRQVTALAPGTTQQVTFGNFSPSLNTTYAITVRTELAGDQDSSNNQISGTLICLPLDQTAYSDVPVDFNGDLEGLVVFNLSDPGALTSLPAIPAYTNFIAGADWMLGTWYGAEYNGSSLSSSKFWRINHLTGSMNLLGYAGVNLHGLAYDPIHGILYGNSDKSLYTIDPFSGLATYIGSFGSQNLLMISIAYDSYSQTLYGLDITYDALYAIDTSTGAASLVGALGLSLTYAQDLAFDHNHGLLYLAGFVSGIGGSLYWINTSNGRAYKVGSFEDDCELSGFAIPYPIGISVPGVIVLNSGNLVWSPVSYATTYAVFSSDDPYGDFTLLGLTGSTSWLDPSFPQNRKFYWVVANGNTSRTRQEMSYDACEEPAPLPIDPFPEPADPGPYHPRTRSDSWD